MVAETGAGSAAEIATIASPSGSYEIVLPHAETDYIQRALLTTGLPHEREMLESMASRLAPGDLVLDVGANVGNHTMYLAMAGCRVVAYEPNPMLADAIELSAERNGLAGEVRVRAVGVGREPGTARFAEDHSDTLGARRLMPEPGGSIPVVRLDDEDLPAAVRAMKIDVGGMEPAVLEGAGALIDRERPLIWIECQDRDSFTETVAWMSEHDYGFRATYNVTPTHLFVPTGSAEAEVNQATIALAYAAYDASAEIEALRAQRDLAVVKYRQASRRGAGATAVPEREATGGGSAFPDRTLRNAELAYQRARHEAILHQTQRDGLAEQVGRLNQELARRKKALEGERRLRKRLKRQKAALEASVGVRLERRTRRLLSPLIRVARGVRRRLVRRRPVGPASPVAVPDIPAPAVTEPPGSPRPLLSPDDLAERAATAEVAAARLRQVIDRGGKLRVAAVIDDFTRIAFEPECALLNLTSTGWEGELTTFEPDLLFVESAWRGQDGSWHGTVQKVDEHLRGILAWCRERQVPTVFWNKEDPIHFQRYLKAAAEFDYVFTTDLDRIDDYRLHLGHDRVRLLSFGCQPRVHNPVETYPRREALAFAGAYYPKFPERMRDLRSLIDAAAAVMPVDIYDRNYGTVVEDAAFPESYHQFIVGTLTADEIDIAYKGYRFGLNLNSVKDSQTMFARRVFELLASNTVTVSNYSRAVKLLFGDLVSMSDSEQVMRRTLEELVADPDRADRLRALGLRKVLAEHTYAHRFRYLTSVVCGRPFEIPAPRLTVVVRTESVAEAELAVARARAQAGVEVVLVVVTEDLAVRAWAREQGIDAHAAEVDGQDLAGLLAAGTEGIAVFSPRDWYGEHYLRDLVDAWCYTDADVVGKAVFYRAEGAAVDLCTTDTAYVPCRGLSWRRSLVSAEAAKGIPAKQAFEAGGVVPETIAQFSVHRFEYCEDAGGDSGIGVLVTSELPIDLGVHLSEIQEQVDRVRPEPELSETRGEPGIDEAAGRLDASDHRPGRTMRP